MNVEQERSTTARRTVNISRRSIYVTALVAALFTTISTVSTVTPLTDLGTLTRVRTGRMVYRLVPPQS